MFQKFFAFFFGVTFNWLTFWSLINVYLIRENRIARCCVKMNLAAFEIKFGQNRLIWHENIYFSSTTNWHSVRVLYKNSYFVNFLRSFRSNSVNLVIIWQPCLKVFSGSILDAFKIWLVAQSKVLKHYVINMRALKSVSF